MLFYSKEYYCQSSLFWLLNLLLKCYRLIRSTVNGRVCLCSILHSVLVKNFSSSSYIFYWSNGSEYNWERSKTICNEQSGYNLVSIESREEWNFLKRTIQEENTIEYFIGLRKDTSTGVWRWLSDNSTLNSYIKGHSPWAEGQPGSDQDNCAQMYGRYLKNFGRYNDITCTFGKTDAGFICELTGAGGNGLLIHITRN